MAELKDAWVKSAKSLVLATNDFICAVAESAKAGRDKVLEWAESRSEAVNADDGNAETFDAEGVETDAVDAEPVKDDAVDAEATEIPAEEPKKKSAK